MPVTRGWTDDRPLRVVHAIDSLRMGGAEALLAMLVRELTAGGAVESWVWANDPTGADPALVATIERSATRLELGEGHPVYDPRMPAQVRRLVRDVRPDLVHSHLCVANVGSRLAARTAGVPHMTTVHTTPGPQMEDSRARAFADAATARLSRLLVAPSEEVANVYSSWAHVPRARFQVVPNAPAAAEPEAFDRDEARAELAPGATRIVVCVARLQPGKGIDELLEVTRALAQRFPGLAVVVAGSGPEHERLAGEIVERGLDGTFLLLGHRSDVGRVLASADVFCLPSHREGLPLSLLEAMRGGLPCVATAVGGIPGLVQDGVSGLLVPPHDPPALAAALERVLADEGFARSLGDAARERVETHHSPRAVARTYTDLYGRLATR